MSANTTTVHVLLETAINNKLSTIQLADKNKALEMQILALQTTLGQVRSENHSLTDTVKWMQGRVELCCSNLPMMSNKQEQILERLVSIGNAAENLTMVNKQQDILNKMMQLSAQLSADVARRDSIVHIRRALTDESYVVLDEHTVKIKREEDEGGCEITQ